ncbi:hypothetical protein JVU11DRAFT_8036 [Chiua virens]|nr:hypothetical protein JVU11DRAFT_8036 [Chiua virens]
MSPSAAHECLLSVLNQAVHSFIHNLNYDRTTFNLSIYFNRAIRPRMCTDFPNAAVPDFQLVIENHSKLTRGPPFISKWVGEVCFNTSPADTRTQLCQIIDSQPDIDLAFVVTIEESPDWASPKQKDANAIKLRSMPYLNYDDFIPNNISRCSLGPVVVENITWISVSHVTFDVYLRRPDNTLDVNREDDHWARGVLYPMPDMSAVDNLLGRATDRLKNSFATVMENSGGLPTDVLAVRQSAARLHISWDSTFTSFRTAVLTAAYDRYSDWYASGLTNHKRKSSSSSSSKNSTSG